MPGVGLPPPPKYSVRRASSGSLRRFGFPPPVAGEDKSLRGRFDQCAGRARDGCIAALGPGRRAASIIVPGWLCAQARGESNDGLRGCSSMVEPQPSKLMVWVRFPSPAPNSAPEECEGARGSAHIAQSVEHFLGKEEVTGSNPVMGSTLLLAQRRLETAPVA
jgi:hypothetical protein